MTSDWVERDANVVINGGETFCVLVMKTEREWKGFDGAILAHGSRSDMENTKWFVLRTI